VEEKQTQNDIVGFFFSERKTRKRRSKTNRVKDFISFAAVKFNKVKTYCTTLKRRKNEGKEIKIEVARKVIKEEEEWFW
jgi:hypothetical protein